MSKESREMKKAQKEADARQKYALKQTKKGLGENVYTSGNEKKNNTARIQENNAKNQLKRETNQLLEQLYDTAIRAHNDQMIKDTKEMMRKNDDLMIFSNATTAQLVMSFVNKNIKQSIAELMKGNTIGAYEFLSQASNILSDAISTPEYYFDTNCINAKIQVIEAQKNVNVYVTEIQQLNKKLADLETMWKNKQISNAEAADKAKKVKADIKEKETLKREVEADVDLAEKALNNIRQTFIRDLRTNGVSIDELIKTGLKSKARRENLTETRHEALEEFNVNNTKVNSSEMNLNSDASSSTTYSDEDVQNIFNS